MKEQIKKLIDKLKKDMSDIEIIASAFPDPEYVETTLSILNPIIEELNKMINNEPEGIKAFAVKFDDKIDCNIHSTQESADYNCEIFNYQNNTNAYQVVPVKITEIK